jgi:alpha-glucoside transport system substrate-binding protein
MARFPRLITLPMAAMLILSACGSSGGSAPPGSGGGTGGITVTSLWGGAEQANFQKVLDAFTAKTGIQVAYESIRTNYSTALQTRISGGNPPDVSILPGIGFLRHFAKDGSIKKISELGIDPASLESGYAPGILDVGKVNGELYAIMVKFNSKSTLWYRPDLFKTDGLTAPKTWDDFKTVLTTLKSKSTPPLGLGTSPDTWTLTDWFESIYLRQAGTDKYDQLFSGKLPWTDPTVQKTVDTMKEVLNDNFVDGGIQAANGRAWVDGIGQVFGASGKAAVYYEGGFVGGIVTGQVNKTIKVPDQIDWTPFPSFGEQGTPVNIGSDVIAGLTTKTGVKEFIQYMTTKESGEVWAKTGAIISPVKAVDVSVYPNDLTKRESAQVTGATAVRNDGSDLLPGTTAADMGSLLQKAIAGQTVDWAAFESNVKAAWAAE